ncbi:kinase-like domain-containing protein [Ganoderma leucocontextum]|nr:kinase-like domain-containing protein [Ganoderma leucocontextum]
MEGGASIASSHVEAQLTTSKPPFSSRAVSWSHFSAATPPSSTSPSIYASSDITSQSSAPSSSAPSKPADWVQQVGVCHREPSYARSAQPGQWAVIQSNLIRVPPLKEGKWITGGVLGTGGFARVYRVFNVAVEKACALKVVRFGRGISGSACAGVINELKVLSMLASEENPPPFLLQPCLEDKLWAWRSSTGNLHIVTEVCDGGSLASYRYGLAYDSLLRASAEIILGLNWLHEHGIVHHDLKPHNILVNGGGHCVIADYGGARFLNSERKLMRGSGTSLVMTTAFAAPEILAPLEDGDVQEYDEAADYWSLGATIVATFMHEDYLPGSADLALMAFRLQKIQEEMQDKGAPEELQAFIMDLLCMDPTQRCRYPAITKQRVFQHLNWEDVESQGRPAIVPRDLVCDAHGWRFPTPGVHRSQDSTADFLEELRAHHLSLELDDSYDLDRHHAHMTRYLSGRIIPRF